MDSMAEQIIEVEAVISSLNEIQSDSTVPRNVRSKIESMITTLKENSELSIKVNKSLTGLDEVANDVNLQSYTRTKIWNVMSLLEKS